MGHKKVCLDCKICLNLDVSDYTAEKYPCSKCGKEMTLLPHRFRPPKKTHDKAWLLVKFLIENGFYFQHIYQEGSSDYNKKVTDNYVPYPKNLKEAKEFITTYKNQARK